MSDSIDGLRILLIDDDMDYSETLHTGLHAAGAKIACAGTIEEGVATLEQGASDLVLLNISASIDAHAALEALGDRSIPILLITGSHTDSEATVSGLEEGADDYLMKPFSIQELCSRIGDIMSDYDPSHDTVLLVGDLLIDLVGKTVLCREESLEIPADERELLSVLAMREGEILTEAELMRALYGETFDQILSQVSARLTEAKASCRITNSAEGIRLQSDES